MARVKEGCEQSGLEEEEDRGEMEEGPREGWRTTPPALEEGRKIVWE